MKSKNMYVLEATGPGFLTNTISLYNNRSSDVIVLERDALLPFDWIEKNKPLIKQKCINGLWDCFELYPDSYGFCLWNASWHSMTQLEQVLVLDLYRKGGLEELDI